MITSFVSEMWSKCSVRFFYLEKTRRIVAARIFIMILFINSSEVPVKDLFSVYEDYFCLNVGLLLIYVFEPADAVSSFCALFL